jgi:hypothetical protein
MNKINNDNHFIFKAKPAPRTSTVLCTVTIRDSNLRKNSTTAVTLQSDERPNLLKPCSCPNARYLIIYFTLLVYNSKFHLSFLNKCHDVYVKIIECRHWGLVIWPSTQGLRILCIIESLLYFFIWHQYWLIEVSGPEKWFGWSASLKQKVFEPKYLSIVESTCH